MTAGIAKAFDRLLRSRTDSNDQINKRQGSELAGGQVIQLPAGSHQVSAAVSLAGGPNQAAIGDGLHQEPSSVAGRYAPAGYEGWGKVYKKINMQAQYPAN